MTPEERFTKIENLLNAITEHQADFDAQLAAQSAQHDADHAKHTEEIEKNTHAIRDLIVVSRTLLDSQGQANGQIRELGAALKTLTEKVDKLTDNIDKLSRGRGPNGNI